MYFMNYITLSIEPCIYHIKSPSSQALPTFTHTLIYLYFEYRKNDLTLKITRLISIII
jgi:hypothetical protein